MDRLPVHTKMGIFCWYNFKIAELENQSQAGSLKMVLQEHSKRSKWTIFQFLFKQWWFILREWIVFHDQSRRDTEICTIIIFRFGECYVNVV